MLLTLMTAGAMSAGLPLDGRRLQPGTMCYVIERDGKPMGETFQSVRRAVAGGRPAWDIVVHQRVGTAFDMRDHFVLDRASMAPIRFDSRRGAAIGDRGWHRVSLRYSANRIVGSKTDAKRTTLIDVPLTGPVLDGNLWGLTFAALPLKAGSDFTLPFWQYDQGFGTFRIKVTGKESRPALGGSVPAWVVEAGTDPERTTRYFIGQRPPRELGYEAGPMVQRLGGTCQGLG